MSTFANRHPYPPGSVTAQPSSNFPRTPYSSLNTPSHHSKPATPATSAKPVSGGYFSIPVQGGSTNPISPGGTNTPPHYKSGYYSADTPPLPSDSITFTFNSDLASNEALNVTVPNSVTGAEILGNAGDDKHATQQQPKWFAFTYHAQSRDSQPVSRPPSDSAPKVMVALEAADEEGLRVLQWAIREAVDKGQSLVIVRVVRQPEGFRGNWSMATELMRTVETKAKAEAETLMNWAAVELKKYNKNDVEIDVKYRVGDHREQIKALVDELRPIKLVLRSNKRRIASRHFHGQPEELVPGHLHIPLLTVPEDAPAAPAMKPPHPLTHQI